jgi:O-antigen/teichoic acid export membrane protein
VTWQGETPAEAPLTGGRAGLTRDSILFGLGSVAGKAVGFVALPIFTRLLTPEEFGRLDVLNALVMAGVLILPLGTDVSAVRLYFDVDRSRQRTLFATWFVLATLVAGAVCLALILGGSLVSQLLFGSTQLAIAVGFVGVSILGGVLLFTALGVLRATGRPIPYASIEGGSLLINAVFAIVLLTVWRADATSVMLALAATWLGAAIVGIVYARAAIVARPARFAASALLGLGLPLVPAVIATSASDFFNRAYLLSSAGATQAGLFSVAIRFASVGLLVVTAAQLAWQPRAYRAGASDEALAVLAVEAREITLVLGVLVAALGFFAPEAIVILGGGPYADALPAIGISLCGTLAGGLFVVASLPSALAKRTGDIATATLGGVAATVGIGVVLAPAFGAIGTACAVALGQVLAALIASWRGASRYRVPFEWGRMLALTAIAGSIVLASTLQADTPPVLRILLVVVAATLLVVEGTARETASQAWSRLQRRAV